MKYLIIFLLALPSILVAQNATPCESEKAHQFDFWMGEWNLTWKDQAGKTLKGKNTITKKLGSCVLEESFTDPNSSFDGMSVSVYSPLLDKWQQTWVDNQGAYLDFVGEFADGKMILSRNFKNKAGKIIHQRMIWYNISKESFDWNWENSSDQGATWNLAWQIHYERAKP